MVEGLVGCVLGSISRIKSLKPLASECTIISKMLVKGKMSYIRFVIGKMNNSSTSRYQK